MRYDSKREADFARILDLMRHALGKDKVESWDRQIRFPLAVNGITLGHLVVDFLVHDADGRKELVEIKSTATQTPLFKFQAQVLPGDVARRPSKHPIRLTRSALVLETLAPAERR